MGSVYPETNDGYAIIEQVCTKGRQGKTILHPMKVNFPSRSITAILGPSGSGKSTLLSVVTDSIQSNVTAKAVVDLPGHAAFCPQDDRLHGFFTCRSYMKHYARLTGIARQPGIEEKIDTLLSKLGLAEQENTIVGDLFLKGLSGGQKRRLSVALEALTEPNNFFLDEPTSGLDSESALKMMEFLHDYAEKGHRVILTIHQPSVFIWDTIDHVILLSKGKLIYNGLRSQMETFFADTGFPTPIGWSCADYYISIVNDEFSQHQLSVNEWAAKFSQWSHFAGDPSAAHRRSILAEMTPTARAGSLAVALELTYRYFLNLAFNPGILLTRIAMYSILALMVGALFWDLGDRNDFESVQSRTAILFYCCAFFVFMSVAVLPFTVIERAIVDKEVQNGYYHPIMYQVAQALTR
jgi:ABC-type multidrug transport system ATPase subunit